MLWPGSRFLIRYRKRNTRFNLMAARNTRRIRGPDGRQRSSTAYDGIVQRYTEFTGCKMNVGSLHKSAAGVWRWPLTSVLRRLSVQEANYHSPTCIHGKVHKHEDTAFTLWTVLASGFISRTMGSPASFSYTEETVPLGSVMTGRVQGPAILLCFLSKPPSPATRGWSISWHPVE